MPKTTKFSELRAKMSPEARAEARRLADEDLKEMPLHELRAARHLTQQQLAKSLDMTQAAVSQLEQRTDVYLSTLENFVEAMGGRLEMYAVFPDGKVKPRSFSSMRIQSGASTQHWKGIGLIGKYFVVSSSKQQIKTAGNRAHVKARGVPLWCRVRSPNGVQSLRKPPVASTGVQEAFR